MGFLYMRRDSRLWWVCWSDASGERRRESTGLTDLNAARQVLEDLERRVAAARKLSVGAVQTVEDYARGRFEERARRGDPPPRDDEPVLHRHLTPALGSVPLGEVRRRHVLEWMRELSSRTPENPASRELYTQLHRLFEEAVERGLLASNPCSAERPPASAAGDDRHLPNHFTRSEVEQLISDARVDPFRRCQWAALALTGAWISEVLCLRVRHCDLGRQPLGRLLVAGRWDSKHRKMVAPKSGLPREVPVHRTLAALLAAHLREALPQRLGRPAEPDDLLFPAPGGGTQQAGTTLSHLQRDLSALGLLKGNLHTLRRTFFALGREDGADPRILKVISEEGGPGDPDVSFPVKCAEIARLDIRSDRPAGESFPAIPPPIQPERESPGVAPNR